MYSFLLSSFLTLLLSRPSQAQDDVNAWDLSFLKKGAAIGDSYSAGIGAGNSIGYSCSRYDGSYSNLVAQQVGNSKLDFTFSACTGAVISDIRKQAKKLSSGQDFVIVSAGGNDAGLTSLLNACVYSFLGGLWHPNCDNTIASSLKFIQGSDFSNRVNGLIGDIKPSLSASGNIYYVGYAKFFDVRDSACDKVSWHMWYNLFENEYLTTTRRQKMNDLVDAMNNVLRNAAAAAGNNVHFIDWDAYVDMVGGRYCEPGTDESGGKAANRDHLFFYEMKTSDSPWYDVQASNQIWHTKRDGNDDEMPENGTLEQQLGQLVLDAINNSTDAVAVVYDDNGNADLEAQVSSVENGKNKRAAATEAPYPASSSGLVRIGGTSSRASMSERSSSSKPSRSSSSLSSSAQSSAQSSSSKSSSPASSSSSASASPTAANVVKSSSGSASKNSAVSSGHTPNSSRSSNAQYPQQSTHVFSQSPASSARSSSGPAVSNSRSASSGSGAPDSRSSAGASHHESGPSTSLASASASRSGASFSRDGSSYHVSVSGYKSGVSIGSVSSGDLASHRASASSNRSGASIGRPSASISASRVTASGSASYRLPYPAYRSGVPFPFGNETVSNDTASSSPINATLLKGILDGSIPIEVGSGLWLPNKMASNFTRNNTNATDSISTGTVISNTSHIMMSNKQVVQKSVVRKLLLSDTTCRIFHPSQYGHAVIANLILQQMYSDRANSIGAGSDFPPSYADHMQENWLFPTGQACSGDSTDTWAARDPMFNALNSFCQDPQQLRGKKGDLTSLTFNAHSLDYVNVSIHWDQDSALAEHGCKSWMAGVADGCDVPSGDNNKANLKHGGIVQYKSDFVGATLKIQPLSVRREFDGGKKTSGQQCMDNSNFYLDRGTLNNNINDFCKAYGEKGVGDPGETFTKTFNDGTPDRVDLSVYWPTGQRNFQTFETECVYYMTMIMDQCNVPHDNYNPMNWKHGGTMTDNNNVQYKVDPKFRRHNAPDKPYRTCRADYHFWGGFYAVSVEGFGFSNSDWGGQTLLPSLRRCGATTNWQFRYYDPPHDDGTEWYAYTTLPLSIGKGCVGWAVGQAGGPDDYC